MLSHRPDNATETGGLGFTWLGGPTSVRFTPVGSRFARPGMPGKLELFGDPLGDVSGASSRPRYAPPLRPSGTEPVRQSGQVVKARGEGGPFPRAESKDRGLRMNGVAESDRLRGVHGDSEFNAANVTAPVRFAEIGVVERVVDHVSLQWTSTGRDQTGGFQVVV